MKISHDELDRQHILKDRDAWTRLDHGIASENEDSLANTITGDDWEFAEGILDKAYREKRHPDVTRY